MPLKNYTTTVPAMKSIAEIQANLVAHGATAVMTNFASDHEPESLSFVITTPSGNIAFRLPANVKAVAALLLKQLTSSSYRHWDTESQAQRKQKALEQATRVGWRIIKDWARGGGHQD